ncbi:MAG TPA: HAMP domain-containing sensor histidine kinase, partial [Pedobacter sp.]
DNEQNELVALSQHSCKHALEILNGFLEVEMEGARNKRLVPTDINAFYKSCLNEQKGLCSIKNIELSLELSSDVVIKSIDVLEFKRAIQNLISNAVKFSYPKSKIKVSSKSRDGKVILKIVDCGIGIPEKVKPYIFDSFTIAQRTGTNGEKSTGLGLYFTKQCIESLDGHIFFRSEYGKGTKVYVTI